MSVMVVVFVMVPLMPVIVTEAAPVAAEAEAVKVIIDAQVKGEVAEGVQLVELAVTPAGRPEAVSVTAAAVPADLVTVTVALPVLP